MNMYIDTYTQTHTNICAYTTHKCARIQKNETTAATRCTQRAELRCMFHSHFCRGCRPTRQSELLEKLSKIIWNTSIHMYMYIHDKHIYTCTHAHTWTYMRVHYIHKPMCVYSEKRDDSSNAVFERRRSILRCCCRLSFLNTHTCVTQYSTQYSATQYSALLL